MIEDTREPKAYVKVLLDKSGELVAVEKDGKFYYPSEIPIGKVPPMVRENWSVKHMTIWNNALCCILSGNKLICWPPCI